MKKIWQLEIWLNERCTIIIVKLDTNSLDAINVSVSIDKLKGKEVVKVTKESTVKAVDEPTFAKIKGLEFKNGTIEVRVLSRLLPNAPDSV